MENKSLKKNYIFNSILTIANFVFPLITYPYVSRILLPEGTGVVAFANSLLAYFILVAQLGIPMYGVRICSNARNDKKELSKVTKELLCIGIITTCVTMVVLFACVLVFQKLYAEKELYCVLSVSLLLQAFGIEWLFKGLEQYDYITKRSLLFKCISVVAIFFLVHEKSDYIIYAGISVFSSSASYICNIVHSRKFITFRGGPKLELKKHISGIFVFFAMSCASAIYVNLDNVMLGFMCGDEAVGIYNTAVKIRTMLLSLITALGTVVLPRASYYIQNNKMNDFWRIIQKAFSFVVLFATPLTIYFCCFARPSIMFLAGEKYYDSIVPMQLIIPTLFFVGISNVTGIQILIPHHKEKIVLFSEIAGAVVDFILNVIFIKTYGAAGAALATMIAEIVVLIVQIVYLRHELAKLIAKFNYADLLIASIIAVASSLWIYIFNLSNFLTLMISAILFFGSFYVYLIVRKQKLIIEILEQVKEIIKKKTKKIVRFRK